MWHTACSVSKPGHFSVGDCAGTRDPIHSQPHAAQRSAPKARACREWRYGAVPKCTTPKERACARIAPRVAKDRRRQAASATAGTGAPRGFRASGRRRTSSCVISWASPQLCLPQVHPLHAFVQQSISCYDARARAMSWVGHWRYGSDRRSSPKSITGRSLSLWSCKNIVEYPSTVGTIECGS
jgi:hypothetical protein